MQFPLTYSSLICFFNSTILLLSSSFILTLSFVGVQLSFRISSIRIGHLSYIENFGISDCWKIDHSFQDQIKNVASRFMSIKSIHVLI